MNIKIKKYYKDYNVISFFKIKLYILEEKERQIKKHGLQKNTLLEWIMILNEEMGELNKEVLQNHYGKANIIKIKNELIQTITVAVNILDMLYKDKK